MSRFDRAKTDIIGSGGNIRNFQTAVSPDVDQTLPSLIDQSVTIRDDDPTEDLNISEASFRIRFNSTDPYQPFDRAFFSVQESDEGQKILYGWLTDTATGAKSNPVKIPLISGLSVLEVSNLVSDIPGIDARPLNDSDNCDADTLSRSGIFDVSGRYAYFWCGGGGGGSKGGEVDIKPSIKYYLTTPEAGLQQLNPSQSLGGFISPTEVYPTSTLSSEVGFDDIRIQVNTDALQDFAYIQIQDEIMSVTRWDNNIAVIGERSAFNSPSRVHFRGAIVRGLIKNDVFTDGFSKDKTQYRCIAIRNESSDLTAKKAEIYFRDDGRNPLSDWRISIELPRSEYTESTVTSGTLRTVVAGDLAASYEDDRFVTAPVVFTSGQNADQIRIVTDYDGITGTLTFDQDLPFTPAAGDAFYIDTAPSQRIPNGTQAPSTLPDSGPTIRPPFLIGDFQSASATNEGYSIDVQGARANEQRLSVNLAPNEAVYVWVERNLDETNSGQIGNRMALAMKFSKV